MGLAQYQIVPQGDEWGILHDGDVKNTYATKEAAFEAAAAAASLAIREGHEIHVSVPDRSTRQPSEQRIRRIDRPGGGRTCRVRVEKKMMILRN